MGFYWVVLAAFLGVAYSDDHCPPPKELLPCTCDEEGVNCMKVKTEAELKKAFSANFKYGATRTVWLQGTPLTSLSADAFGKIKSRSFFVEVNNISTVDLDAFRASRDTVTLLSFYKNRIVDFPFSDLKHFKELRTLNMALNMIQTIPDNALQGENLWTITFMHNQIRHIGRNAFANLPNLGKLDLSSNQLVTIGPEAFASTKHGSSLLIYLAGNTITDIDDTAFEGTKAHSVYFTVNKLTTLKKKVFEPLVVEAAEQGGVVDVGSNPLSCRGCEYSWIVTNKNRLANTLTNFRCSDGTVMQELTKPQIGC